MFLEIKVNETTAIKLGKGITLSIPSPVLFTGLVKGAEYKWILCHGTEDGMILHNGQFCSAKDWVTQLFTIKPFLVEHLKDSGGELYLICCHQDKQPSEVEIPGGKLIVTFPDWEGENKVFLGETFEDGHIFSFANKKLLRK